MADEPNQGKVFDWAKFKIAMGLSILEAFIISMIFMLGQLAVAGFPPTRPMIYGIVIGTLIYFCASVYSRMKTPIETIIEECTDDITKPPKTSEKVVLSAPAEPVVVEQTTPPLKLEIKIKGCLRSKMIRAKPLLSLFAWL